MLQSRVYTALVFFVEKFIVFLYNSAVLHRYGHVGTGGRGVERLRRWWRKRKWRSKQTWRRGRKVQACH